MKRNEKISWQQYVATTSKKEIDSAGIFKSLDNAKKLFFRVTTSPAPELNVDSQEVPLVSDHKKKVKK